MRRVMSEWKFSVLMSVYAKENPDHFSLALKSNLEDQTLQPDEMVLVCDGPLTPELDEVISQYAQRHPEVLRVYRLAENGGLGKALNYGLSRCRYEWVARSDSDDVCDRHRFELQIAYLKEHPDVDILGAYIDEFDSDWRRPIRIKRMPQSHEAAVKRAQIRNPINHMTAIFRKSVVEGAGSYLHLPYMEDYFLWVRAIYGGARLANIGQILVHARVGNGMAVRRGNRAQIASRKELDRFMVEHRMIGRWRAALNMVCIVAFTNCPNWVRKFVYDKILRETVSGESAGSISDQIPMAGPGMNIQSGATGLPMRECRDGENEEKEGSPLVSVVMPAYNAERFIAEAIQSVLDQTVQDIELIVIDDCSADRTCEIAEEFAAKDNRVQVLRNERNMGVARTRNRGLALCRGEYVALLDSDDIWYPAKLEKQIEAARRENADIVYCSYSIVDEERAKVCADFVVPPTINFEQTLSKSVISCSTALMTRETVRDQVFTPDYYHEDLVCWLCLLRSGKKAVGILDVLAEYRISSGSKSFNKWNSAKCRWKVYREVLAFSWWKSLWYFGKYALNGAIKYRRKKQ